MVYFLSCSESLQSLVRLFSIKSNVITYLMPASGDNAARYVKARDVLQKLSVPESYDLALGCLAVCANHKVCPKPAPTTLPTRVLDCSDARRPRLVATNGAQGTFAALSYVWGMPQPNCTKSDNIETYLQGIPIQLIPHTIKDAITSVRKLGLQYLWVDAFCIIQDSRDDKRNEIAQMRHYYEDAYVTLIAASAPTVNHCMQAMFF